MVNEDVYGTACQQSKSNQLEGASFGELLSTGGLARKKGLLTLILTIWSELLSVKEQQ